MQGILVVLIPVLLAGFALLMDRFESAILAEPEQIDDAQTTGEKRGRRSGGSPAA